MTDATTTQEGEGKKIGPVAAKRIIRMIKRRHPPAEVSYLNITAMMDMMSILLVYLLKQFAVSSNAPTTPELLMPYSTSTLQSKQAVAVSITSKQILVDNRLVVTLRNSYVDPSDKQGGANSYLVTPLLAAMQQERTRLEAIAARNPSAPFEGLVTISADKNTPYRVIAEVLYTVGQARFGKYRLVVLSRNTG